MDAEAAAIPARVSTGPGPRLPLTLRIALRDLRGGLAGFAVFLACIALGVAAIVGVGSVSLSLKEGLAHEGRAILGGDLSFTLAQHEASGADLAPLTRAGRVSAIVLMRAMARAGADAPAPSQGEAALVEIKAVDGLYPLAGAIGLAPDAPLAATLAKDGELYGVAVDPTLPARLGLKLGDEIRIGEGRFLLRAILAREPDQLAGGVGFGPRVMMSEAGLAATRLLQPGALAHFVYRVTLGAGERPASPEAVAAFAERVRAERPDAGWEIRTRENISPQFSRNLDRFSQFLTLVGLSSLIVGGVGVANAARAYVARKRAVIAILKSLGASGSRVFVIMLIEVMLVAGVGVALGAVVGALLPYLAASSLRGLMPFPLAPAIHPSAIAEGALYGFLTALAFSILPLGAAHDVPAQAIFRDAVEMESPRPRRRYIGLAIAAAAALLGSALLLAGDRRLTLIYLGVTLAAFAALRLVAFAIQFAARRAPPVRSLALRLAIANIHRPGALTPSIALSLGLGLSLLVALALIDQNIRGELTAAGAGEAPSFFFLDAPGARAGEFSAFVQSRAPDGKLVRVPMLRGRIVRLNGVSADLVRPKESVAWVLQGDRGVTFAADPPEGSTLIRGEWWPKDYAGPPLVSLESQIADGLGLDIGDEISVNVLGRTITGKIASVRKVEWRRMGINFVLLFSPNVFAGAPYSELATLTLPPGASPEREAALTREIAAAWPAVTSVRVKEALEAAGAIVAQLAVAVRAASSVAIAAAVLALAGAIAAGQQARIRDAVILKTLGATRPRLAAIFLYEYALIGAAIALFGALAGTAAAYGVVTAVMDISFRFYWLQAFAASAGALAFTIALGLAGTWRVLTRKPAPYLRDL